MNHYPHHVGDFNNATRHLTFVERALYRELLDLYYDTERPLIADVTKLARRVLAHTDEQREALQAVLDEFFNLQDDGWHNDRCDREIAAYHERQEQQSRAGRASAAKRALQQPGDDGAVKGVGAGVKRGQNKAATDVARPLNDRSTNQNQNQNHIKPPNPPAGGAEAGEASPAGRGAGAGQGGATVAGMGTATALCAFFPEKRRNRLADVAEKVAELEAAGTVTVDVLLKAAAQQADKHGKDEGKACPNVLRWLKERRWLDSGTEAATVGAIPADWRESRSGIEGMGMRLGLGPWNPDEDKLLAGYLKRVERALAAAEQEVPA